MRSFIIFILFASTSCVYGQQRETLYASAKGFPINIRNSTPVTVPSNAPGLHKRNSGRTLTIIGGAMLLGGVILLSQADATYYSTGTSSNGNYESGDIRGGIGSLMVIGGLGMTIPGMILWNKGAKRYKRYLEDENSASITIGSRGVGLRYTF